MTSYWISSSGSVSSTNGEPFTTPGTTWTATDEATYNTALAAIQAAAATALAATQAAEQALQLADYEALVALHVPDATARRLTGFTGTAPGLGG